MQSYTTPGGVTVAPNVNIVQQLMLRADAAPDHPALAYRDGDRFTTVSTAEVWATVQELAAGLVASGVRKGDRVALHCGTRIEFTYLDYAIWAAGAATTTIYDTSSAEQVKWIISDSGSVALISENADTLATYDQVKGDLTGVGNVFVIDDGAIEELRALATDDSRAEVKSRIAAIAHDDLATLVYTSGTTGNPKGCVLTHHNFVWNVENIRTSLSELASPKNRTYMFLPLAHIFARLLQALSVSTGTTI